MQLKIKPITSRILYIALILPLLIAGAAQLDIIDLSKYAIGIIMLLASFFIISELRGTQLKKDILALVGIGVSIISILFVIANWLSFDIYPAVQGVVTAFIIFYVIIEAFR